MKLLSRLLWPATASRCRLCGTPLTAETRAQFAGNEDKRFCSPEHSAEFESLMAW